MTKRLQRQRQRARTKPPRPHGPSTPSPGVMLPGWTRAQIRDGGAALAQGLHTAALRAQARSHGGYAPASVMGHFLAPLKVVYQTMDTLSATVRDHATAAFACTAGCFACCRLYVEVGPWEAFGIADYVMQACEEGAVVREALLGCLRNEVQRFTQRGGDKKAMCLCAFLTCEGTCGIYPARPASCRSFYSNSRAACERYFGQPVLEDAQRPGVVRTLDHGVTSQLTLAESQAAAQAPFPPSKTPPFYEMQSMVLRILETPNALVRYLHGEDIFQGCARYTPEHELRAARAQLVQLEVPGYED